MTKSMSSKKVTFAENVKKHDGVVLSDRAVRFYKIICGYLNGISKEKNKIKKVIDHKIDTDVRETYDILIIVGFNQEVLKYCRYRSINNDSTCRHQYKNWI